jgi:hypothetical protein
MTSKKLFYNLKRQHEHAAMMLPWLNSDKLNKSEKFEVMQHLQICDHCRAEWSESQTLKNAFRVQEEQRQWQPSEDHFNRLLNKLDAVSPIAQRASGNKQDAIIQTSHFDRAADNLSTKIIRKSALNRPDSRISSLISSLRELPSFFRWLIGIESIALASFCLVFVMTETKTPVPETALYETLTSSTISGVEPHGIRVSLIFDEKMTESDIRKLLQSTGGQMVSGPSYFGVYTVEIAANRNVKASIDDVLSVYRTNTRVRVLEPEPTRLIINLDEHS